jgi:hypothetical protein
MFSLCFKFLMASLAYFFNSSIFPEGGRFAIRRPHSNATVLLAVDVAALLCLDAHPGRVPQFEEKGLRGVAVRCQALIAEEVDVFSILACSDENLVKA